jgi:hypothetical protein
VVVAVAELLKDQLQRELQVLGDLVSSSLLTQPHKYSKD